MSSSLCCGSKEEKDCICCIPYVNTVCRLMFALECLGLDISHEVGVFNGQMDIQVKRIVNG
jgi:hypothetical protein